MARESKRVRDERRFGKPVRLADIAIGTPLKGWTLPPFAIEAGRKQVELCGEAITEIQEHLADCPIIDGTSAARAYWNHPLDVWRREDFPSVAPPFAKFFIELAHPGVISVDGGRSAEPAAWCPRRWGVLFLAHQGPTRLPIEGESDGEVGCLDIAKGGWAVHISLIVSWDGVRPSFYPAVGFMGVDPSGEMIRWPMLMSPEIGTTEDERQQIQSLVASLWNPTFFVLSFMHCKNVVVGTVNPDPHINRERRRHGLRPFVRYHTINVDPMKRVLRTEGQIESVGLKRAMHICRGHFVTYTEEKPLFGRVSGTFWKEAHVRGEAKEGIVISDYNVNLPRGIK